MTSHVCSLCTASNQKLCKSMVGPTRSAVHSNPMATSEQRRICITTGDDDGTGLLVFFLLPVPPALQFVLACWAVSWPDHERQGDHRSFAHSCHKPTDGHGECATEGGVARSVTKFSLACGLVSVDACLWRLTALWASVRGFDGPKHSVLVIDKLLVAKDTSTSERIVIVISVRPNLQGLVRMRDVICSYRDGCNDVVLCPLCAVRSFRFGGSTYFVVRGFIQEGLVRTVPCPRPHRLTSMVHASVSRCMAGDDRCVSQGGFRRSVGVSSDGYWVASDDSSGVIVCVGLILGTYPMGMVSTWDCLEERVRAVSGVLVLVILMHELTRIRFPILSRTCTSCL